MNDHEARAENRQPEKLTMTVIQAALVLGISRTTAYECVRQGSIPSLRLGHRIVVPRRALDELLNTPTARETATSQR